MTADLQGKEAQQSFIKMQQSRKSEMRHKDYKNLAFRAIEQNSYEALQKVFQKYSSELQIMEIVDDRGYTLLHEACFNNCEAIAKLIVRQAIDTLNAQQLAKYLNSQTYNEGFTALHFCSFKGNTDLCTLLIQHGADMFCRNNFGINVLHTAAQGDQPITLLYFKEKGLDLRSKDFRDSTPLHWACYSKSEVALVFLLAWVHRLDDRDIEGFTPLHLAVRSVETLKSTRPVRALLMRGAPRNVKDNKGRLPADLISDLSSASMRQQLIEELDNPRTVDCLMIKTPLKRVPKSFTTVLFMWFLMSAVYVLLMLFVFPCKSSNYFSLRL